MFSASRSVGRQLRGTSDFVAQQSVEHPGRLTCILPLIGAQEPNTWVSATHPSVRRFSGKVFGDIFSKIGIFAFT